MRNYKGKYWCILLKIELGFFINMCCDYSVVVYLDFVFLKDL